MTTLSIWEEETFFARQDVIIAGGGLLGLWSALELITKSPQTKITILDKSPIPSGASTRNAGFACFGSPTEMIADVERMGEDKMWEIVEMRYKGIQKIRQYFHDSAIGYDSCGGYECFSSSLYHLKEIEDKIDWINEGMQKITGTRKIFSWSNDKLARFGFAGFDAMIENSMEAGLHSGLLLYNLTRKVQAMGVNILTGIQVTGFEKNGRGINVITPVATIPTTKLLICTNALASKLVKDVCIEPARGQVFVTEPIDNLKMRGTFHYDEGFYYFRNLGKRILIGGARNTDFAAERTDELVLNERIQHELEAFVSKLLLPHTAFKISHRWSGIMGFSENKLPLVKEVEQNVYVAIACNGMGVALSPVIAERVCAIMG